MTYFWAKNVIFYAKISNCCKMAPDEDTEWPNISKCSFFQALTLCQISCFPPKTQDWLDIGSYAPALVAFDGPRSDALNIFSGSRWSGTVEISINLFNVDVQGGHFASLLPCTSSISRCSVVESALPLYCMALIPLQ